MAKIDNPPSFDELKLSTHPDHFLSRGLSLDDSLSQYSYRDKKMIVIVATAAVVSAAAIYLALKRILIKVSITKGYT